MLLTLRSLVEAMPGLIYCNAPAIELAGHAEGKTEHRHNQELADLHADLQGVI